MENDEHIEITPSQTLELLKRRIDATGVYFLIEPEELSKIVLSAMNAEGFFVGTRGADPGNYAEEFRSLFDKIKQYDIKSI